MERREMPWNRVEHTPVRLTPATMCRQSTGARYCIDLLRHSHCSFEFYRAFSIYVDVAQIRRGIATPAACRGKIAVFFQIFGLKSAARRR
jgi:hypothetical protein